MVETADGALDSAAESSFGALAGAMGAMVMVASTLLIILVLVSFALQTRSMDGRTALLLLARLVLINAFALNWVQFNAVSSAIIDGLDQLGGAMVESMGGAGPEGAIGFAGAIDEVLEEFARYLNAATTEMGWMAGAMITAFGTSVMGIVGALAGGVLIFSKIMLTLMIGLAPVMIAASIFDATKDYFHRWLSALVGYAMYPLIIAGVMSTIVGMARSMMSRLGDPNEAGSIGALLPFFAMVFMAAGMIAAIPLIVKALSGNVVMPHAPSALGAVQSMMTRYTAGQRRSHERERERREQARWNEEDRLKMQVQRAGSGSGNPSGGSGQTVVNYQEMMARNRRLDAAGVTGPSSLQPKPTAKPTS